MKATREELRRNLDIMLDIARSMVDGLDGAEQLWVVMLAQRRSHNTLEDMPMRLDDGTLCSAALTLALDKPSTLQQLEVQVEMLRVLAHAGNAWAAIIAAPVNAIRTSDAVKRGGVMQALTEHDFYRAMCLRAECPLLGVSIEDAQIRSFAADEGAVRWTGDWEAQKTATMIPPILGVRFECPDEEVRQRAITAYRIFVAAGRVVGMNPDGTTDQSIPASHRLEVK